MTPHPFWHALWVLINSQLGLTVITIAVGTVVARWLAEKWRRKSELFKTRLDSIKVLLDHQADISHMLEKGESVTDRAAIYRVMMALALVKALFPAPESRAAIRQLYEALAAATESDSKDARIEAGKQAGKKLSDLLDRLIRDCGVTE